MPWLRRNYMTRKTALHRGGGLKRGGPMRTQKRKEGSRLWLRDRLDSLTAQIVKVRDGHRCVQCKSTDIIDAGHVYPRGMYGTRWALDGVFSQCRACNTRHIGRPEFYLVWYAERFGSDALAALRDRAYSGKNFSDYSTDELRAMVVEYEAKLAQLRSDLDVAA